MNNNTNTNRETPRKFYVVTRQIFYMSDGFHYQMADDTPVVAVFSSLCKAKDFAMGLINSTQRTRIKQSEPKDSGFLFKIGAWIISEQLEIVYTITEHELLCD